MKPSRILSVCTYGLEIVLAYDCRHPLYPPQQHAGHMPTKTCTIKPDLWLSQTFACETGLCGIQCWQRNSICLRVRIFTHTSVASHEKCSPWKGRNMPATLQRASDPNLWSKLLQETSPYVQSLSTRLLRMCNHSLLDFSICAITLY